MFHHTQPPRTCHQSGYHIDQLEYGGFLSSGLIINNGNVKKGNVEKKSRGERWRMEM
ncbi:hypothetical protein NC651_009758 [Populus alba x Populus x berolinensis]|nr:hypothetical protein NC651_009758 [Populus alba x Populus x berolinensis]